MGVGREEHRYKLAPRHRAANRRANAGYLIRERVVHRKHERCVRVRDYADHDQHRAVLARGVEAQVGAERRGGAGWSKTEVAELRLPLG